MFGNSPREQDSDHDRCEDCCTDWNQTEQRAQRRQYDCQRLKSHTQPDRDMDPNIGGRHHTDPPGRVDKDQLHHRFVEEHGRPRLLQREAELRHGAEKGNAADGFRRAADDDEAQRGSIEKSRTRRPRRLVHDAWVAVEGQGKRGRSVGHDIDPEQLGCRQRQQERAARRVLDAEQEGQGEAGGHERR